MKKFTFITTIFILVVSIFFIIIQSDRNNISIAAVIQKAFDATDAVIASSEIYIRGRLAVKNFESANERQQLLDDIITGAGGDISDVKPVFSSIDNDSSFGAETDYIINDNSSIHISILKSKQEELAENYQVSISLTDTSQQPEMTTAVAGLKDALKKYKISPVVNICITGSLNGNLKDSELEAICKKVFDSVGAEKVEGMRDNGLISVSAFSPSISNVVRVNGKRVNLNIAVRYNSYEGKTYIWLATPVITTEY